MTTLNDFFNILKPELYCASGIYDLIPHPSLLAMSLFGELSIGDLFLICSAEYTWDYAVFAESPFFMSSKSTSNIWWMAPVKPCGLQISYNVILLLVWFTSMTLCKEQSAAFSKNTVPRFKYSKRGKIYKQTATNGPKLDPRQAWTKLWHKAMERLLKGVSNGTKPESHTLAAEWLFALMQNF